MATECELAWAAGLFDGEGSIGIYRNTQYHNGRKYFCWKVKARVACCSKLICERLAEITGEGTVHLQRRKTKRLREVWSWSVYDSHIIPALQPLVPYLVLKREQVELGMEFRKTVSNHGSRGVPAEVLQRQSGLAETMKAMKLIA